MARMFNPPHPGLTLRDDVLPALSLSLSMTEAAQQLGVRRAARVGPDGSPSITVEHGGQNAEAANIPKNRQQPRGA